MKDKEKRPRLVVTRDPEATPPEQRGRLLEADEVASEIFRNKVSARWVLETIPHNYRHKIGRIAMYYEAEVRAWIETQRGAA